MNLTEHPEIVEWPETHYVFVEKVGPFLQNAPQAWAEAHKVIPALAEKNTVTGYISLYDMGPMIYRAGVSLAAAPLEVPEDMRYEVFEGGKYSKFTLKGPYSQLGPATGRVFELVSQQGIALRSGFCIENYGNDPRVTPEAELISEILVPTA